MIDSLEFDPDKGKSPNIVQISGDVYAIAYTGNNDDGFVKTVQISSSGQITDTVTDSLEFDTARGETPNIIQISGDVYTVAYSGNNDDGFLATLTIGAGSEGATAVLAQGTHVITLTVDDGSDTDTDTVTITVVNAAPTANAGADQTVTATSQTGASVTLDGSGSSDPDGDSLTYSWASDSFATVTGQTASVTLTEGTHSTYPTEAPAPPTL